MDASPCFNGIPREKNIDKPSRNPWVAAERWHMRFKTIPLRCRLAANAIVTWKGCDCITYHPSISHVFFVKKYAATLPKNRCTLGYTGVHLVHSSSWHVRSFGPKQIILIPSDGPELKTCHLR